MFLAYFYLSTLSQKVKGTVYSLKNRKSPSLSIATNCILLGCCQAFECPSQKGVIFSIFEYEGINALSTFWQSKWKLLHGADCGHTESISHLRWTGTGKNGGKYRTKPTYSLVILQFMAKATPPNDYKWRGGGERKKLIPGTREFRTRKSNKIHPPPHTHCPKLVSSNPLTWFTTWQSISFHWLSCYYGIYLLSGHSKNSEVLHWEYIKAPLM